jgi:hypothetical protein
MRRRSLNPHSRISSISHAGSAGLFADRVRVLVQKPVKIRCEVYLFPVDRGKLGLVATHLVRIKKKQRGDSMRTQKPSVELEDWAVVPSLKNGKYEELRPGNLLVGRAFGHQRIRSGTFIFTSLIVSVDQQNNIAETRNTSYRLGEASHEYKLWSKERGSRTAA